MYSNYLAEVGKLVYLIGEVESTSTFKKMLESPDPKQPPRSKYFFKCVDELPPTAYRKVKVNCRRKGILRCDWFNKILDRVAAAFTLVSHDDLYDLQLRVASRQDGEMGGPPQRRPQENQQSQRDSTIDRQGGSNPSDRADRV